MMTKKQYAKSIVNDFCKNNLGGKDPKNVDNWGPYLFMSSSLAVALEFLGLLDEHQKEYSTTRGGTVKIYYDEEIREPVILSTRELLSLLPD